VLLASTKSEVLGCKSIEGVRAAQKTGANEVRFCWTTNKN